MSCVKMRKLNIIVICIFCSQDLYRENKKFSEWWIYVAAFTNLLNVAVCIYIEITNFKKFTK